MILNVITAVSRPENLPAIADSLKWLTSFDVEWHVVFDGTKVDGSPCPGAMTMQIVPVSDCAGGAQKNAGLKACTDGLVYFLDDDNLIHPGFNRALRNALNQDADLYVFGQCIGDRTVRVAEPKNLRHGKVDCGQFVVRADFIGDVQFPIDVYESDWHFLKGVLDKNPRTVFSQPATFYNALKV